MATQPTKLYTLFADAGMQHFESEVLTPVTNDQVLRQLQERCPEIAFEVRDASQAGSSLPAAVDELVSRQDEFDGVLVFGGLNDYRPVLTGLPTVAVYNFPNFSHLPFALFAEHSGVIGASLDRGNLSRRAQQETLFDDLVAKIGLLDALARLKRSRILLITDRPFVDDDVHRGDLNTSYPDDLRRLPAQDFNEAFGQMVRDELGAGIIKIGTAEVAASEGVQHVDEDQAQEIARGWIAGAEEVRGTIEREVINSARMYLAIRALMDEHDANASATHIRSLIPNPSPQDMVWPSLANSQLQMEGVVGCCQGHMNVVLTHMLAQYGFGRPSMMGDFMVDAASGVGVVMHCGAPWNPWGGARQVPYVIRDHAERMVREHSVPGAGACSEVLFPPGEPATVWRIDVPTKSILTHTGQTVDAYSLYRDWTTFMCRSKLVVELEDAARVQSHLYPDVYGVHRSGTLGDFRERIRQIAQLLGFRIIEDDRQ
ncbi:MAG: hypothetical protein KKI08_10120 [Armatimonadetes bacterium]|nr:hypothetical protein [Armatimonadota bacterium]